MAIPNVVIFGETGSGKSSLVNQIAGDPRAPISSSSVGCTFWNTPYTVTLSGKQFTLYDTAGFDEGQSGTVPKSDAFVRLYSLLRRLENGVNLLIFCMRGPRIKESCARNWQLFYNIICDRRVPIILAVTGLENEEEGMDSWWTRNKQHFMMYEIFPTDVACITTTRGRKRKFGDGNVFDEDYEASQEKIRKAITTVYLRTPWQVQPAQWFKMTIRRSFLLRFWPFNRKRWQVLGSAAEELVRRGLMTADEAKELAELLRNI